MTRRKEPPKHPHVALAERYVDEVLSGKQPAGRMVRLACERHRRDLAKSAKRWPYYFDPDQAEKVCRFLERMPHVKGEWARKKQTVKLEPWQCFKTISIFGWRRKKGGRRRFRQAWIFEPRKNAKSTWAAGVGLYMLAADGEAGAEVYSGATSKSQAFEVFGPAQKMARKLPDFRAHFGVEVNASNINIVERGSRFEPLIGKPGDGASPSCSITDEYHEHPTPEQYDTMITGMGARAQPLAIVITTAGDNIAGPCYDLLLDLRKILEGTVVDEETWGIEYAADPEDDWTLPATLAKANPNLNVSVDGDYLRARQLEAIRNPRNQARFKTKHLNLWVSSRSAYFNIHTWNTCRGAPKLEEMPEGADVYVGLDLASTSDLCALELLFPLENGNYIRHGFHYLPEDVALDDANEKYKAWAIAEKLRLTEGNTTDYGVIKRDVLEIHERFRIKAFGYDNYQANMLATELGGEGVPVMKYNMNVGTMSQPMKELDAMMKSRKLLHDCAPTDPMSWMISNVVAKPDAKDNVYPRKERDENKIDGPVALIVAVGLELAARAGALAQPEIRVW